MWIARACPNSSNCDSRLRYWTASARCLAETFGVSDSSRIAESIQMLCSSFEMYRNTQETLGAGV